MIRLIIGLIYSFIIALIAYQKKSLSMSGFIGAILLGTFIYFLGSLYLLIIMVSFFISSSLLTKFKQKNKYQIYDINEKTGERDYAQVIANGSLGLLYSLMYYITKQPYFMIAYATAFAAANADTWASELGVLSKHSPRSILNFKKVAPGSSGAISLIGTIFSFLGSAFISLIFTIGYVFRFGFNYNLYYYFSLVAIGGFLGSIIDSLLGASLQGKYQCGVCSKFVEMKIHHDKPTQLVRGVEWMNNDVVNFLSGLIASGLILLIAY